MKAFVRPFEQFETAVVIAGHDERLRQVELLVRVEHGDVDRREPLERCFAAALEPVDQCQQLPRVRHAGKEPLELGAVPFCIVQPSNQRGGVAMM